MGGETRRFMGVHGGHFLPPLSQKPYMHLALACHTKHSVCLNGRRFSSFGLQHRAYIVTNPPTHYQFSTHAKLYFRDFLLVWSSMSCVCSTARRAAPIGSCQIRWLGQPCLALSHIRQRHHRRNGRSYHAASYSAPLGGAIWVLELPLPFASLFCFHPSRLLHRMQIESQHGLNLD